MSTTDNWEQFWLKAHEAEPLDLAKLSLIVKFSASEFPTDEQLNEYYTNEFTKYVYFKSRTTSQANRQKWHSKDKFLLIWCVVKQQMLNSNPELKPSEEDWAQLEKILNVKRELLYLKWLSLLHTTLKIAPWTPEEDQLLIQIAKNHLKTNNWTEMTIEFNASSHTQRYAKQIRERWNNVLNPQIMKLNWTREEKIRLLELVLGEGKKWSKIQTKLPGRTENQIKNQYNGMLRNTKKINISNEEEQELLRIIIDNPSVKISTQVNNYIFERESSKKVKAEPVQQQIAYPLPMLNNMSPYLPYQFALQQQLQMQMQMNQINQMQQLFGIAPFAYPY